jgi:hypothetical protein
MSARTLRLRPVRGAIHVHTDYDDGYGSIEEVVDAAEAAGLDYLVVTDHHDTYAARDGWRGRVGGRRVLVVVGAEYRTAKKHHLLGAGIDVKVATPRMPNEEALRVLKNLNAATWIAHPQGCRQWGLPSLPPWTEWGLTGYDGIEMWSYMHDWLRDLRLWRLPRMCREPGRWVRGPDAGVLRAWDTEAEARRVAGLGGLDVHAKPLPLGLGRLFSWARGGILPYRHCFEAFAHHVYVPASWGDDDQCDRLALLDSLKEGTGWASHEALAPGRDFHFLLEDGAEQVPLGCERLWRAGQRLLVRSPRAATLRIVRRGEAVCETEGTELDHEPAEPGAYRVEAFLEGRPWIYTNHVYLRPESFRAEDRLR